MEKTITIDGKDVRLNNNIGWTFEYRDQFGKDIIPTLLPMAASLMDIVAGLIEATGKVDNVTIEDIARLTDGDFLIDAIVHAGSLEFVDFLNIVWALAKCADETIAEPKRWLRQFDEFPLDTIVPEVLELILKGIISSKNLERLNGMTKKVQPKLK